MTEAFTPDLYLPDLDLYVEVTVQRQANSRPKHQKVRHFHARYPKVRLELWERAEIEGLLTAAGRGGRFAEILGAKGILN